MARAPELPAPENEIDLHGLRPDQALRRLAQELHAARVRGDSRVRVITGRGWGNRLQQPVLRPKVETWLRGPDGRRLGVQGFDVACEGGALDVALAHGQRALGGDPDDDEPD